jgi:hypothetical protein
MVMFQRFLSSKLLEDYTKEPYTVNTYMLTKARCVSEQNDRSLTVPRAKDDNISDEIYQNYVVFPLEEMMLNRNHVENKLRTAFARQGQPGSDIQPLIDRCDWAKLAAVLTSDRELVAKLKEPMPIPELCERILQGINQVQAKYFTELKSPSTFTISTHAREMSAKQTTTSIDERSTTLSSATVSIHTGRQSADLSKNGFTWNIYNSIASRFREKPNPETEASPLLSDTFWNTESPYVNLKKIE